MNDIEFLQAQIRSLEAECRALRETLRDRFACQAMQMRFGASGESMPMKSMAAICYQMADAMIEARKP